MANIEQVREFFSKDRFATENGAVIDEVREDYARVSLTIAERHKNAVGGVMGGVYFMLADFAFAVATNWKTPGTVSLSSDISFLSTPKGKRLIAETELIRKGRTTCCYNVMVRDDLGKPIAAVKIVGYIG